MKAIVVGAGIGGLTTALSLHQAGIDVSVYESVREPGPLGVGINIGPLAIRELTALGLGPKLEVTGMAPYGHAFYNKHGQRVWEEPLGRNLGYKWPQISIHRGHLFMVMYEAALERLGAENFHAGHHLESFEQDGEGVTATFINQRTGETVAVERADLLIGADGVHSNVRRAFYPDEGAPNYGGNMMWRAAVEMVPFLDGHTNVIIGHRDQKIVTYRVTPAGKEPGTALINWIAEIAIHHDTPPIQDWNRRAGKEEFLPMFKDWRFDWIDVPAMIEKTDEVFVFPKVDRDPIPRWTFGRVTLLGDAAHPMHPAGGQGGTQAVVDARVLTKCLILEKDAEAGLKRYEEERLPIVNAIVLSTRALGPDEIMQIVEERAPDGFKRIEDVMSREEMDGIAEAFRKRTGANVDAVNATPSILEGLVRLPVS